MRDNWLSNRDFTSYDISAMVADILADARTGKIGRHALVSLLRQSVFGWLAGYEDCPTSAPVRQIWWVEEGRISGSS